MVSLGVFHNYFLFSCSVAGIGLFNWADQSPDLFKKLFVHYQDKIKPESLKKLLISIRFRQAVLGKVKFHTYDRCSAVRNGKVVLHTGLAKFHRYCAFCSAKHSNKVQIPLLIIKVTFIFIVLLHNTYKSSPDTIVIEFIFLLTWEG